MKIHILPQGRTKSLLSFDSGILWIKSINVQEEYAESCRGSARIYLTKFIFLRLIPLQPDYILILNKQLIILVILHQTAHLCVTSIQHLLLFFHLILYIISVSKIINQCIVSCPLTFLGQTVHHTVDSLSPCTIYCTVRRTCTTLSSCVIL